MKNRHRGDCRAPFPFGTPVSAQASPVGAAGSGNGRPLPAGWRRLDVDLPGSRLYRVTRSDGAAEYWDAERPLNHGRVRRRFASELQARAWLHLAAAPRIVLGLIGNQQASEMGLAWPRNPARGDPSGLAAETWPRRGLTGGA